MAGEITEMLPSKSLKSETVLKKGDHKGAEPLSEKFIPEVVEIILDDATVWTD